jgi:hypothetical protein
MVTCPGRIVSRPWGVVPAEHFFGTSPASLQTSAASRSRGSCSGIQLSQRKDGLIGRRLARQPRVLRPRAQSRPAVDSASKDRPMTRFDAHPSVAFHLTPDGPMGSRISFDERTEITPRAALRRHGSRHPPDPLLSPAVRRVLSDEPDGCSTQRSTRRVARLRPTSLGGNDGAPAVGGLSPGPTGRRPGRAAPAPAWAEWARCRGA